MKRKWGRMSLNKTRQNDLVWSICRGGRKQDVLFSWLLSMKVVETNKGTDEAASCSIAFEQQACLVSSHHPLLSLLSSLLLTCLVMVPFD